MSIWRRRKRDKEGGSWWKGEVGAYLERENQQKADEHAAEDAATANRLELESQLAAAEKEYQNLPTSLRERYASDARRVGTYSDTPEWQQGLTTEVNAGLPGAQYTNLQRQNAIRAQLGMDALSLDPANAPARQDYQPTQNTPASAPDTAGVGATSESTEGGGVADQSQFSGMKSGNRQRQGAIAKALR
jgi:hypothetical protein